MLVMCNDCAEVIEVDDEEYQVGLTMCPCGSVNLEVIEADDIDVGDELEMDDQVDKDDELEMGDQVDQDDELEMGDQVDKDDELEVDDQVD